MDFHEGEFKQSQHFCGEFVRILPIWRHEVVPQNTRKGEWKLWNQVEKQISRGYAEEQVSGFTDKFLVWLMMNCYLYFIPIMC